MLRDKVVAAARTWVGTPYHHMAAKKGVGVDCGMVIIRAFSEAGIIQDYDPPMYHAEWCLHRHEERYLDEIRKYLTEIDADPEDPNIRTRVKDGWSASSGDVLIWKVGRTFSHGGIVTEWPAMVHAYFPSGIVEEVTTLLHTPMAARPMKVFTFSGFGA